MRVGSPSALKSVLGVIQISNGSHSVTDIKTMNGLVEIASRDFRSQERQASGSGLKRKKARGIKERGNHYKFL